ncbi:MAG: lysylphosphatidylglycerol synthase domain-containing protein [Hyphomicrobiales bacterium]
MSRPLRLLIVAAGAALLAWLIARVGIGSLLEDARSMGWMIVPVLGLWLIVYAAYAAAWHVTLEGAPGRPRYLEVLRHSITGFALNYLTPVFAWSGEPYKAAAVSDAVGGRRAAGSVVAYNLIHTLSHQLLWILAAAVAAVFVPRTTLGSPGALRAAALALGLAMAVLGALLFLFWRRGFVVPAWNGLGRSPRVRSFLARLRLSPDSIAGTHAAAVAIARERPGRLALAVGIDLLGRAAATLEFWLIFIGVGSAQPLWMAFLLGGLSTLLLTLLFFLPYEVGAREGGLYLLFQFLGLDPSLAVFSVIVIRLREIVWIGAGLALAALPARRAAATEPARSA